MNIVRRSGARARCLVILAVLVACTATAAPALATDAFMILNTTQLDPHPVASGHAGGGGHIDAETRAPARTEPDSMAS